MILVLILSTISVGIFIFFAGYKLATHVAETEFFAHLAHMEADNATGNPIFAEMDREFGYTDRLDQPCRCED